jgi:predicted metal-dependent hydrolase
MTRPRSPALPLPPALALLRHARANRQLSLGDQVVAYELKHAQRRTIGFAVGAEGLVVSAPRWVGQEQIDLALHSKARWILRKLADQHEHLQRVEAARIEWRDGTRLPFLGEPLAIMLTPGQRSTVLQPGVEGGAPPTLRVGLPQQAAPEQIRRLVQLWLQRQALALFEQRCRHYAPLLGVQAQRLRLSAARTRWGSASSDGSVRLNWRLIHFGLSTIDYVVVHELAHLREMNHSPAFWALVAGVMPHYQQHRQALKASGTMPQW